MTRQIINEKRKWSHHNIVKIRAQRTRLRQGYAGAGPALISPLLPARRAHSSERGVVFILDAGWNNGMVE